MKELLRAFWEDKKEQLVEVLVCLLASIVILLFFLSQTVAIVCSVIGVIFAFIGCGNL